MGMAPRRNPVKRLLEAAAAAGQCVPAAIRLVQSCVGEEPDAGLKATRQKYLP
jgi:hypothetical protein